MPLYFAYGSNLDPAQLADREVAFREPRRAAAIGWKLAFNKMATINAVRGEGRANILPARDRAVEGVVFDIAENAFANLDWYEGAASGHYERRRIAVRMECGETLYAQTYVARLTGTHLKPSRWYLDRILTGARHFGLSPAYIAALAEWPVVEETAA